MRKNNSGIIKFSDIIFAAAFVAVCIVVFLFLFIESDGNTVVITQNGQVIHEIPLNQDSVIKIGGTYSNTVIIENCSVHVEESTCPNHICERGNINSANECLVCAPNRLTVYISGEGEIDAVTQ